MTIPTVRMKEMRRRSGDVDRPSHKKFRVRQVKSLPAVVHLSLLLFIFSFPFENIDLGVMKGSLSISKIFGFLFFGSYLYYFAYGIISKRVSLPRSVPAVRWFLIYLIVMAFHGFFVPAENLRSFLVLTFTLTQLIIFLYVTFSFMLRPICSEITRSRGAPCSATPSVAFCWPARCWRAYSEFLRWRKVGLPDWKIILMLWGNILRWLR